MTRDDALPVQADGEITEERLADDADLPVHVDRDPDLDRRDVG